VQLGMTTTRVATRAVAASLAAAGIVGAALAGVALWPAILVSVVAVAVAIVPAAGVAAALGAAVLGVGVLLLLAEAATAALALPLTPSIAVVVTAITLAAAVLVLRRGAPTRPSSAAMAIAVPSIIGAAAFPILVLVGAVRLGAASVAWAMRGDAALFLTVAVKVVHDGGVALDETANAVPLPTALIALAIDPGRAAVPPGGLLEHDLVGLVVLWTGLIAVAAMLAGAIVGTIVREAGGSLASIAVSAGAGSLLLLSWLFGGYPIQYGFVNAHVAMVILFGAILVVLGRWALAPSIVVLAGACLLLFATWSPLAMIPFALAVALIIRRRRDRSTISVTGWVAIAVAGVVLAAWVAVAVVPGLLRGAGAQLAVADATAEPYPPWLLPLLAAVGIVLAAAASRGRASALTGTAIALGIAGVVGLLALLVVTQFQWTYYPRKMAWLASLPIVVVGLGAALATAWRLLASRSRSIAIAVQAGVVAVAMVLVGLLPVVGGVFDVKDLAVRVLTGGVMADGDDVAATVLELADADHAAIVWRTASPGEPMAAFWLMMAWAAPGPDGAELVELAYAPDAHGDVDRLCAIGRAMEAPVLVRTDDPGLEAEAREACGEVPLRFASD